MSRARSIGIGLQHRARPRERCRGIAEAVLIEAVRIKKNRPFKLLALAGEVDTPASNDRIRGLTRAVAVMSRQALGPDSVELTGIRNLDWSRSAPRTSVREFVQEAHASTHCGQPTIRWPWARITALREAGYKPGVDVVVGGLNCEPGRRRAGPEGRR